MSHGLFNPCNGRWVNYRKPSDGIQQQKCSKCGRLRNTKAAKCSWFSGHEYRDRGKPNYGKQKQVCRKCGDKRTVQADKCSFLWGHDYSAKNQPKGQLRCRQCGEPK